ncbi:MAG: cytochrome c oxidase subunit 3 [Saprospiraceae bacterium]|nr:cytochrome c oxidase subunit 3 [Saprospiraceae bacterium]MCB0622569.1 cytochrome c oxidase subunit 3 [Saprospiraceae bacterium]MCB0677464.1 cytochrome c oxidase subunit 3 [Saprospiraceae bacterium]MCB0681082.1 cytochrome c oxidase subunit 3 [Saprospiraceae bacterium]
MKQDGYNEYDNFSFHPYNVLLILVLMGVSALFLAFTAAFVYTRVQNDLPPLRLPAIFLFNTLILLGGSASMVRAKRAYQHDNTAVYQRSLWITIGLSLLFLVMQFAGWQQLFRQNIFLTSGNSASYLYVISGLHFAHVIAGLPFLALFLQTARRRMKEPVSVLVYFSDPEKRLKLRLLTIYWHFLDGLWIYLVLFFWVNYLFR